jgi:hypothetical protein
VPPCAGGTGRFDFARDQTGAWARSAPPMLLARSRLLLPARRAVPLTMPMTPRVRPDPKDGRLTCQRSAGRSRSPRHQGADWRGLARATTEVMPPAPDASPQGCPCASAPFPAIPSRLPGRSLRGAVPPGERTLRSLPYRSTEGRPARRSAPELVWTQHVQLVAQSLIPSLHRCLSTCAHPRVCPLSHSAPPSTPSSPTDQAETCVVRFVCRSTPGLCSTDESVV